MRNKWNVTVNGISHEVAFKPGVFRGKMIVDGTSTPIKSNNVFIRMFDVPVDLDGTIAHLTAIGNKVDLAVDGVYLNSKKEYVPFNNIPKWIYGVTGVLFVAGWALCGLMGILLGLISSMLIFRKSLSQKGKNLVPFSVVIAVICIILDLVLFFGFASML